MLIGYARVSTVDQTLALQRDALSAAGCEKIFTETASGTTADRIVLREALDYARGGDLLVVWRLDRLCRSAKDALTIADDLHKRNIGLKILTGRLSGIYTPTGEGKFFFTLMAAVAELEHKPHPRANACGPRRCTSARTSWWEAEGRGPELATESPDGQSASCG